NLDARGTVAALGEEQDLGLAWPLSEVSGEADQNGQPVACLPDAALLDPAKKITEAQNIEPTAVARALDRGYALDFLLQLKAARGADAAKDAIEARRSELGRQLHALRSIVDGQCADLREPAYALPEDGLANLAALAQGAEQDFADALVIAAGNTDGEAGTQISATAFSVIQALHCPDPSNGIWENAAAGESTRSDRHRMLSGHRKLLQNNHKDYLSTGESVQLSKLPLSSKVHGMLFLLMQSHLRRFVKLVFHMRILGFGNELKF